MANVKMQFDLNHIDVTNLNTEIDFRRKAQEILPDILATIGEETGKALWDEMQKSFRKIRGLKVNHSHSDKNRFIRETAKEYQKKAKQSDCLSIEQQIVDKLKLKRKTQLNEQENSIKNLQMSYQAAIYKVFIASPGDVQKERDVVIKVLDDWNTVNSEDKSIVLLPIRWETHAYPEMGAHPQEILNKQILKNADILIGIFWSRLGTPTEKYPSGTVEEITEHINAGKPAMLYFSKEALPSDVDVDQLERLRQFKEDCRRNKGLVYEYANPEDFHHSLRTHLSMMINKQIGSTAHVQSRSTNADIVVLGKEAETMLLRAYHKGQEIVNLKFLGGCVIGANGSAPNTSDSRTIAVLEAAIEELENCDFIKAKGYKREIFSLTKKGYEWCDHKTAVNNESQTVAGNESTSE